MNLHPEYVKGVKAAAAEALRMHEELALSGEEEAADAVWTLLQRIEELSRQRS